MQTIIVKTHGSKSYDGLDYTWDLFWDIKTKEEARRMYAKVCAKVQEGDWIAHTMACVATAASRRYLGLEYLHKPNKHSFGRRKQPLADVLIESPDKLDRRLIERYTSVPLSELRQEYSRLTCKRKYHQYQLELKAWLEELAEADGFKL